jgi:glycosyltransferase involved in cell wall biosynthesis
MNNIRTKQVARKFTFDVWGEREAVVWNASRSLAKKGHEIEILATKALSDFSSEMTEGISIKRFKYFYPYSGLSDEAVCAMDRNFGDPYSHYLYSYLLKTQEIDILHSHATQRITNTIRLAARKKNIPYVVSLYNDEGLGSEIEKKEMKQLLVGTQNYGKIIDFFLKNKLDLAEADGIICARLDDLNITREKYPDKIVEYIPNGVDVDKFKIGSSKYFREHHNINADADIILCVSRIDSHKNQIKLVELVNLLNQKRKRTHLLLIGQITSKSYYQELQLRVKELNLDDRVTIITSLSANDPEIVKAYQAADFFILPSIQESFDHEILEAWASRLPVISHKIDVTNNLITEKHNGLLYENDSLEDLAAQYYYLKDHPDLRVKLIHNAYDEVCEKYTWQIITEKWLDFYREVIEKYKTK